MWRKTNKGHSEKEQLKFIHDKREKEISLVAEMIRLYCRKKHRQACLCDECNEILAYCEKRINSCPFMEEKTFCSQCSVHCYSREMQEKIKMIMIFSGARMLLYHPIIAIHHMIETIRTRRK